MRIPLVFLVLFAAQCSPSRQPNPPVLVFQTAEESLAQAIKAARGEARVFVVSTTNSMQPMLRPNDLLVVEHPPFETLRIGDIILYHAAWLPLMPVAHRLVAKDSLGLILSGDANPRSESQWRVTRDTYIGKVIAVFRAGPPPPP